MFKLEIALQRTLSITLSLLVTVVMLGGVDHLALHGVQAAASSVWAQLQQPRV
jgi:hypothetical protein